MFYALHGRNPCLGISEWISHYSLLFCTQKSIQQGSSSIVLSYLKSETTVEKTINE